MRIIAGEFRSRLLTTPADSEVTRPIPDRVKESLFSILRGHVADAVVFDAFAGTGAIGLEALSRGAARCVFVERDKRIAGILQKNIDTLAVRDRAELVVGDALGPGALARCPTPVNLAFLDPPYPLVQDPIGFKRIMAQLAAVIGRLDPTGYAVLRTPWPFALLVADPAATPEASADPAHKPRKERRAKERKRALRDPDLAERWSRRSTDPRYTPIPGPAHAGTGSKKPVQGEPRGDELVPDDVDLDDFQADMLAELEDAGPNAAAAPGSPVGPDLADQPDAGPETDDPATRITKSRPALQRLDASLAVSGARGPETHIYGSMAVHLYMRA